MIGKMNHESTTLTGSISDLAALRPRSSHAASRESSIVRSVAYMRTTSITAHRSFEASIYTTIVSATVRVANTRRTCRRWRVDEAKVVLDDDQRNGGIMMLSWMDIAALQVLSHVKQATPR